MFRRAEWQHVRTVVITGGSADTIRKHEPWLPYWVSEPDRGQAHAINKGFAQADGEVFGYLNSDDLYVPGALAAVAHAYAKCRRKARFWAAFGVEDFDQTRTLTVTRPRANNRLRDWIDFKAWLHQPGVFWSRQMFEAVGGFDESMSYAFDRKFFVAAWQTSIVDLPYSTIWRQICPVSYARIYSRAIHRPFHRNAETLDQSSYYKPAVAFSGRGDT